MNKRAAYSSNRMRDDFLHGVFPLPSGDRFKGGILFFG